jgi:cytochrome c biogenesis protein CcmG, thiol:disulfide interchange protein DsbE
MRRLAFIAPLVLFAVVAVAFLIGFDRDPKNIPSVLIDKPVPAFDLAPLAGTGKPGVKTADLQGDVRLINVFASWCVPCRIEHPVITQLVARGLPVIGINHKDKTEDAVGWLQRHGDPYVAIGVDADGRASIDLGVYGVPESFLIDRQGRIRYKHVGPITPDVVEKTLWPLVQELRKG